jgi:hypothetical protein
MYENNAAEQCFEWVRSGWWTWFVTLKYPREASPKHKGPRRQSAEDAFADWISQMYDRTGKESFDGYVRVTERRDNGDILIHVLLRGIASKWFEEQWSWQWFDMSAGAAWERPLDDKIEGLFRYFFFRVHCDLECCIGGEVTVCRADEYTRRE